jgi:hypothetical protein
MSKLISFLKKLCKCKCVCDSGCHFEIRSPSSCTDTPPLEETQSARITPVPSPRVSPRPMLRPLPQVPNNQNTNEGNNVYVTVS